MTIGVGRAHVLPTPLSSFTICAPNSAARGEVTSDTKWLLEHGVAEILILPEHASSPQRVLDHGDERAELLEFHSIEGMPPAVRRSVAER